jgi:hypothetical protein
VPTDRLVKVSQLIAAVDGEAVFAYIVGCRPARRRQSARHSGWRRDHRRTVANPVPPPFQPRAVHPPRAAARHHDRLAARRRTAPSSASRRSAPQRLLLAGVPPRRRSGNETDGEAARRTTCVVLRAYGIAIELLQLSGRSDRDVVRRPSEMGVSHTDTDPPSSAARSVCCALDVPWLMKKEIRPVRRSTSTAGFPFGARYAPTTPSRGLVD